MQSQAATVAKYIDSLPADRRTAISAVRTVILANLDQDYVEEMAYGMIGYVVPHSVFPAGYHCNPKQALPFAMLASQKNHMSLHMFCLYVDGVAGVENNAAQRFQEAWTKTGKKLDMGKGCVRFKKLEDVPLEVIGDTIRRIPAKKFIAVYTQALEASKNRPKGKPGAKKVAKKTAKKVATKSTGTSAGKSTPKAKATRAK